jgi:hypothetical protein
MEPSRLHAVVLLALAALACTPPDAAMEEGPALARREFALDAGAPPCPIAGGNCVPVAPAIPDAEACPATRWIAVLSNDDPDPNSDCPPPPPSNSEGSWTASRLFGSTAGRWALPPGLQRFCVYNWNAMGRTVPSSTTVNALKAKLDPDAVRVDSDCHVVAPLGTSNTLKAAWQTLHTDFHAQTGRVASLPSGQLPPAKVRVAVVDSSPHRYEGGDAVEDRLGHGHAMGRVIRELGCPDAGAGACITQVANHLALPLVAPNVRDIVHGGYFGEQTRLAQSIHVAVSDWRSHNAGYVPSGEDRTLQPRLVVNLSLAWDPRYKGEYSGDPALELPAPVYAVHEAIRHARCHGALVIAAAGNDPGGPGDLPGPMYPAGWEQKRAPTSAECEAFEEPAYDSEPDDGTLLFPPARAGAYQPLVYAVGGVRADDTPLENSRPGGRPRLAAPGAHALAADFNSSGVLVPTDVLTGSSISAATVSGIAATVWGYRPALTGPEVMELVRQGSVSLGTPADFCLGGNPCPWIAEDPRRDIRRVSLCKALTQQACAMPGGLCPDPKLFRCGTRGAYSAPLPQLTTAERATIEAGVKVVDGSTLNVDLKPLNVCNHDWLRSSRFRYDLTVCPGRQYYGIPVRPWTNPQPSKNPCTLCLMDIPPPEEALTSLSAASPTANLYISIDSEYSLRPLDSPSLLINGKFELDISALLEAHGEATLMAGDELKVANIPLDPSWLPIQSAALNLRGEELGVPYSTSSELLLQTMPATALGSDR